MKRTIYDKEILINFLNKYYDEFNKIPTSREIAKKPEYPSINSYQKYFGSWKNALIESKIINEEEYNDLIYNNTSKNNIGKILMEEILGIENFDKIGVSNSRKHLPLDRKIQSYFWQFGVNNPKPTNVLFAFDFDFNVIEHIWYFEKPISSTSILDAEFKINELKDYELDNKPFNEYLKQFDSLNN